MKPTIESAGVKLQAPPGLLRFELQMPPYAVAHFKFGLALAAMDEEPLFHQQWSYEPHAI